MLTSSEYWALFDLGPRPELTIRACGLNCRSEMADQCNNAQCAFFRAHMV